MTAKRNLFQNATRFFTLLGAAGDAAAAADAGRKPRNRTLEILGINPDDYRQIGR